MGARSGLGVAGRQGGLADTEAALELIGLQVAECHGQSVGGIGRFGDFLQAELGANHKLHLAFVGMAIASHAGFDFAGGIAADLYGMLFRGEKNDATHFREAQRGAHVQCGEDRFYGEDTGLELLKQLAKTSVNIVKSCTRRELPALWRNFRGAIVENVTAAAGAFDDGVTGGTGGGWIDAENAKSAESFGHDK